MYVPIWHGLRQNGPRIRTVRWIIRRELAFGKGTIWEGDLVRMVVTFDSYIFVHVWIVFKRFPFSCPPGLLGEKSIFQNNKCALPILISTSILVSGVSVNQV